MKRNKTPFTNIIAGKYKGKKLSLPSLDTTRSSKSILKESFFNTIQFEIIDKIFIEAFGGSGSMGLEAISRGAKEAYFVEIDKNAFNILKNNIKLVDPNSAYAIFGDSFVQVPKIISNIDNVSDIILYIDPPFDIRDGMNDIYNRCFKMLEEFAYNKYQFFLICIEHSSLLNMPKTIQNYTLSKTKKFGKSSLSYYLY